MTVLAALATMLAVACSTKQYAYDRPGTLPGKLDSDMAECRRESRVRTGLATVLRPKRVDQDLFNHCMERRGYTVRELG